MATPLFLPMKFEQSREEIWPTPPFRGDFVRDLHFNMVFPRAKIMLMWKKPENLRIPENLRMVSGEMDAKN